MNLAANLTATAERHGARTALALGATELTYEQLDTSSARVAGMLLARGLRPGDRVGVMLGNVPEFAMAYYGVRACPRGGRARPELGEEIGAAVALRTGADLDVAELREFVKAQVAAYKYPRHLWLVDELPKGATGKILKRAIELPVEAA
jgi:acyl-CoA synthetase (AMP-forming)/AMP-acid ligase II